MCQDGIFEIEAEVVKFVPGRSVTARAGWLARTGMMSGVERTDFEVGGAFAEFEGADDRVGNDAEADA